MKKWMEEKEEMKKHIERLEKKMEEMQARKQGTNENGGEANEEVKRLEKKMRGIEIRIEREEREKRRKNIVIRGIRGGKEKVETEIRKLMKENGVKEEGLEIKTIEDGKEGEVKLAVVKMEDLEEKKRSMRERRKLGEKGVRIEDDLTWEQRRMKWKMEEAARNERENGKRVWLRYGRIQIEGKWWRWDEEEEVLKDEEGRIWKEKETNRWGLSNKDREFWRDLEKWDAIVMMETWVEEKGWRKVRDRLPEGFIWRMQAAVKKNKKGRAAGGMMIGIRKEVAITDTEREEESEGVMIGKVKLDKKIIRVVGAYVNGDMERKLSILEGWMEQKEEGRCSKDKKINKEGKKLIQSIKERGWYILNGGERGDWEGNWTYSGGIGESVIDYVIVEQESEEEIERMEIVDKIDSDHQPIVAWLKGHKNKEARRKRTEREGGRGIWDEEGREPFRDKLGEIGTGGGLDEEIDGMEGRIREAMEKVEGERETGRRKRRGWWDEECKEVKGTARKALKEWLRGKGERQEYRRKRKEYKELCERKKEEENKNWRKRRKKRTRRKWYGGW
ncbi:PREDICTED: golgin subfamily A member 6-like protein 22 [Vollenhovia emeryi]|uniref:golgin subfamily A member 6-like protein 22 n=1 Tax=Vollenhovia emeryi TaxID=411798 RepID=UPI0005F56C5B|nr:PREDICTED: golgin subfamily A member 6-like protein 22 [Vollenhovia emeryi]